jgi:hypothetical protein
VSDGAVAAAALGLLVVGIVCIFGGAYACDSATCSSVGKRAGKRTEYELLGGCFIEVNGRMIPQGSWRGEEDR